MAVEVVLDIDADGKRDILAVESHSSYFSFSILTPSFIKNR